MLSAEPSYALYHATLIHTPELGQIEILPDMLLGVNSKGQIDFMERFSAQNKAKYGNASAYFRSLSDIQFTLLDLSLNSCQFLFPGFIDTHIHALQYPNVGIGSELPLLDWLKDYTFPMESKFCEDLDEKLKTKVIEKTLSNGTTCASYFVTIDTDTTKLLADLLVEKGQRGLVGKVCMNDNPTYPSYAEPMDACIEGMHNLIDHCMKISADREKDQNGLVMVKPIVTPRFAPVCLRELMTELGALSRDFRLPIQTHISENLGEIQLVKNMFPECENYASVYEKHGLLGPSTILAHAIHLSKAEREIVQKRQCSISHCPTSNSFLTSGEAPIKTYLYEDKINVSLGTDISGGYEQSILGVAKNLVIVSHHLSMGSEKDHKISVADALYMATMGGARACNLAENLGSLKKGKIFDAQLVDVRSTNSNIDVFDFQIPHIYETDYMQKMTQLVHKWVFSGDDRNCIKVWCNGKLVVDK